MPIYEYCCQHCGHAFDKLQKISDAPITLCPHCQQHTLTKLVSAAGFRLSGSGWYETDFKSDTEKKRNLSEKTSSASAPAEQPSTGSTSSSAKTGAAQGKPKKESTSATSSGSTSE